MSYSGVKVYFTDNDRFRYVIVHDVDSSISIDDLHRKAFALFSSSYASSFNNISDWHLSSFDFF